MEELDLLYSRKQSWNPKQAITLKHLIMYNNLRTYINFKGMIDMPITDRHVWGHAYGHDNNNYVKWCGCSLILIPHLVIVGGYVSSILQQKFIFLLKL
jgi:hypothetical protein